jgi:hypothetical protein
MRERWGYCIFCHPAPQCCCACKWTLARSSLNHWHYQAGQFSTCWLEWYFHLCCWRTTWNSGRTIFCQRSSNANWTSNCSLFHAKDETVVFHFKIIFSPSTNLLKHVCFSSVSNAIGFMPRLQHIFKFCSQVTCVDSHVFFKDLVGLIDNIPGLYQTQTFPHTPFSRNHEIQGLKMSIQ